MADLLVLEQNHRESERKLASARLTKEHRIRQRNDLESQLQDLKFSNGGLRAQLNQYRELLATLTRELGERSIYAGAIDGSIREGEKKLSISKVGYTHPRGLHWFGLLTSVFSARCSPTILFPKNFLLS